MAVPPPAPPPPAVPPDVAWRSVLPQLSPFARAAVEHSAAFIGYTGGILRLAVRSEASVNVVREPLRAADFTTILPGFRNVEVVVDTGTGQTGREARAEALDHRREAATKAARSSATVRRVLDIFGGEIESVEISEAPEGDKSVPQEEASDE